MTKRKLIILFLLCMALLAGCAQPTEQSPAATEISLGSRISIEGSGAELNKNVITIFKAGTYIFEGALEEGQIVVNANDADVHILLNGADITCSYSAALYIKAAANVTLALADGTDNRLADGAARPSDDSIDGAVYSKTPLTIDGGGSLSVNGTYKHGLCSKEPITISGGDISISSVKTALDCNSNVTLEDCSLDIAAGTNGIRSGREDKPADISINGGSFTISSEGDGVKSYGNIDISGGDMLINAADDGIHAEDALTVSGGSIAIPYCYEGLEGRSVTITDGVVDIVASDDGINTAWDDGSQEQTFEPQMSRGETPQMPDSFEMPQMPDDFAPPEGMEIPDGAEMPQMPDGFAPPEGMERPSGGKGEMPGGFGGMPMEEPQEGVDITISGGVVTVCAQGDCLDSNGNIYITGGLVYVSANRFPVISAAEAGIDCNGSLTVSGGSLIGAGTSASQTDGLKDRAIVYYGESTFDEDTVIRISDSKGSVLFEFTSAHSFNSVIVASPMLTVGEVYTLTIGELSEDIELTEELLTVGESQVGPGGFGGFGGFAPAQRPDKQESAPEPAE